MMPSLFRRLRLLSLVLFAASVCVMLWLPRLAAQEKPAGDVRFEDVAIDAGIEFRHQASRTPEKYLIETMGSGVALLDADGDGMLDIYLVNGAAITAPAPKGFVPEKASAKFHNRLYRQAKGGRFQDVTSKAGLEGRGYGMGVAVADYDNDGDQDLYVTGYPENILYRNQGDGTFEDVTRAAGAAGGGWSASATFVDYDHDGLLDIFFVRYLDWSFDVSPYCGEKKEGYRAYCHPDIFPGAPAALLHNRGDGTFADVSKQAGVADPEGKGLGVAIADFDGDGLIDIGVANDSVRQFLYRNRGNATVEDIAVEAGVAVDDDGKVYAGMGIDFSDYDNDARPDLLITNLSNQRYALYRNDGDQSFTYATHSSNLGRITLLNSGWGLRFIDVDHDGWKDAFIAQSHVLDTVELTSPHIKYLQPPLLARNLGNGRFQDISATAGDVFSQPWAARGLASGDIDNDGDIDVVITTTNGRAYVLRNDSLKRGGWLQVRLTGKRSNRDGIGAAILLVSESGATQHATVTTGSSYLS